MELASETGASCNHTSHRGICILFTHNYKGAHALKDALVVQCGWLPSNIHLHCVCGSTVECPRGGFPIIRHNEIRVITAIMLLEQKSSCYRIPIGPHCLYNYSFAFLYS